MLWHQSMAVNSRLEQKERQRPHYNDEGVLFSLLKTGIIDVPEGDRPDKASTRSMRYTAALVDRLWVMWQDERERCLSHPFCLDQD